MRCPGPVVPQHDAGRPLKIGVVGCGRLGTVILRALLANGQYWAIDSEQAEVILSLSLPSVPVSTSSSKQAALHQVMSQCPHDARTL